MSKNDERNAARTGNVQEERKEKRSGEHEEKGRSTGGAGSTGKESVRPQTTRTLIEPDRDDPAMAPRGMDDAQDGQAQGHRRNADRNDEQMEDGDKGGEPRDGSKSRSFGSGMSAGKDSQSADRKTGAPGNSKR